MKMPKKTKKKPIKQKIKTAGKIKPNANIRTKAPITWCPGCFNFAILSGVENVVKEKGRENFAIASGIGCHAKIFDYLNLPGLYALHGRVIPICQGMKLANPKINIIGFSGDGDAYDEGMAHLIHACRLNPNIKYIVHNNQVFALTVAQPTPVTETGYVDKTTPFGVKVKPINPIKLVLAAGASFVARVFADVKQIGAVLNEALSHKGFCFIEVLQPCLIFHPDTGYKEKTYDLQKAGHDKTNLKAAMERAEEWNYNGIKAGTKIPLGIFYQTSKPVFEDLVREGK